jgi:putative transposase
MKFEPGNLYHIYNQGNNRQVIFTTPDDYFTFLKEVRKLVLPHCEIIAWCLMPNHFHFLIYADERVLKDIKQGGLIIDPLTNGFRKLLSGYARIFNSRYNKTGSLFRQKTKSKCLSQSEVVFSSLITPQDYYFNCFHYIHQNPLKARLVNKLEDWEFSSFKDYAALRNGNLCNKQLAVKFCAYNPLNFLRESYAIISDKITSYLL